MPKPVKTTKLTTAQATAKARAARAVPGDMNSASGTMHLSAQDLKVFDVMKPADRGVAFSAGLKIGDGITLDAAAADRLAALVRRLDAYAGLDPSRREDESEFAARLQCYSDWEGLKSALGPALVDELLSRETIQNSVLTVLRIV